MMDSHTKVVFTTLHLEGEADFWFQTLQVEQPGITWGQFIEQLLQRFSSGSQENLVGKFNKLTQTGSVRAYIEEFEELRGYMLARHSFQTEEFYLSSFLSGERADIQQALYVYRPPSLRDAMDKAKEQGHLMDLMEKRIKGASRNQFSPASQKPSSDNGSYKPWQNNATTNNPLQKNYAKIGSVVTANTRLPEVKKSHQQKWQFDVIKACVIIVMKYTLEAINDDPNYFYWWEMMILRRARRVR